MTEVEKRTIEKIMADKVLTAGASKFLHSKLSSTGVSSPSASKTNKITKSPKAACKKKAQAAVAKASTAMADDEKEAAVVVADSIVRGERIELIVDRSGSMRSLLGATVAGLNSFLTQ